jgi:uncharacterized coiled-coil DUF342 family protein
MSEENDNSNNSSQAYPKEEKFKDHPEALSLKEKLNGMSKDEMKKITDTLRLEINQLSSTISDLKKTREEYNNEARHYRQMRNNTNDEKFSRIEILQEEALQEKELRDECNQQVQEYKERREQLKEQMAAAWEKVNALQDKYRKVQNDIGVMPGEINEELKELEWKQQTSSLSPEEDAELTKRIAELLEKSRALEKIGFSPKELDEAQTEAKNLSEEHDTVHEKLVQMAEEGQRHHQRMIDIYEQLDGMRSSGTDLHSKYLENRNAADITHQKIVELYEKIKLNQYLLDLIDEERMRRRHERSMEIKKEKIAETRAKKSSNKRLTLNELRLLMGEEEEE